MTTLELDDEPLWRNIVGFTSILSSSHAWPNFQTQKAVEIRRPAKIMTLLLYSSGMTGLPKGVSVSLRNMMLRDLVPGKPDFLQFKSTDVILSVLQCSAYGMTLVMSQFHCDATAITMNSFVPEIHLDIIEKHKVTMLVPPMLNFTIKNPIASPCECNTLEKIIRGAPHRSPVIRPNVRGHLGNHNFRIAYGNMLSGRVHMIKRHTKKTDRVERRIPGVSYKTINQETSRSIGTRKSGKKCFKANFLKLEYSKNWHVTHLSEDRGYYDEGRDFFIVGGIKELIKSKAFQVSPNETERLLFSHPDVMDAAAVSIPDDDAGELSLVFVVKIPNSKVTAMEICEFVNAKITPHNKIRAGVHFVNVIPKTPAGQITRSQLPNMTSKL